MKKMLSLLLALAMVFSLAACGGGDNTTPVPQDTPADAGDTGDTGDAADAGDSTEASGD